jgi:membrane protein implicated in regulation of membrane protease activity
MHVLENQSRLRSPYSGEAIIDKVICQNERCRVRFHGIYWSAEAVNRFPLYPNDVVKVVGRKGLVLLIKPFSDRIMKDRALRNDRVSSP